MGAALRVQAGRPVRAALWCVAWELALLNVVLLLHFGGVIG